MSKSRIRYLPLWTKPFILLLFLTVSWGAGPAHALTPSAVIYDRDTDLLTVKAEDVSLRELLAKISLLTGVEMLMDPEVEQNVSIILGETPLQSGLKQMMRIFDLNHAMIFESVKGEGGSEEHLLVSMKIVPKGKLDSPNLVAAVDPVGEAIVRTLTSDTPADTAVSGQDEVAAELPSMLNYAEARWQARLKKMPKERRDALMAETESAKEKKKSLAERRSKQKVEILTDLNEFMKDEMADYEEDKETSPEFSETGEQQPNELLEKEQ
jgi:hypothetical protein